MLIKLVIIRKIYRDQFLYWFLVGWYPFIKQKTSNEIPYTQSPCVANKYICVVMLSIVLSIIYGQRWPITFNFRCFVKYLGKFMRNYHNIITMSEN